MTNREALNVIADMCNALQLIPNSRQGQAMMIAINSLKNRDETKMDKLKELEKRMDRIKILMDATRMSMEEMLAAYADASVDCADCPIKCTFSTSCFDEWLKYLNGGD